MLTGKGSIAQSRPVVKGIFEPRKIFMCQNMRPDCAKVFGGILKSLDATDKQLTIIRANQDKLFTVLLGNGDPAKSIASRLTRIETQVEENGGARDRFWKVASVIIACVAVLIAWLK